MPHIIPDRRRFNTAWANQTTQTQSNHRQIRSPHDKAKGVIHRGLRCIRLPHTLGTKHKTQTMKNAYSIPHPVPPKITPKARMVPATAPISLLVAMLTVWREKGRFFKKMITSYMSEMKTWNNSSKEYFTL